MSLKSCTVNALCIASLVCLSVGPVALFYFCAKMVRLYVPASRFIPAKCAYTTPNVTTVPRNVTSEKVGCTSCNVGGGEKDNASLVSCVELRAADGRACPEVNVQYVLPRGVIVENARLYETYEMLETHKDVSSDGAECPSYICLDDEDTTSSEAVNHTTSPLEVNSLSRNFSCFVDPQDGRLAIRMVPAKEVIFNGLLWPVVIIVVGIIFCIFAKVGTRGKD